jgi:transmembrane 9 superfamily protein 2/4
MLGLLTGGLAIHWPGFGHGEYAMGEVLPLRVAKLTSTRTQMPFSFFSLAQCTPQRLTPSAENIGEVLHGDRILNAPFELQLGRPRYLALCRLRLDAAERAAWVARIRDDYRAHLLLDNLPVAMRLPPRRAGGSRLDRGAGLTYQRGYSLGAVNPQTGAVLVHNHLHFTVYFSASDGAAASGGVSRGGQAGKLDNGSKNSTADGGGTARIVGFEVIPTSRAYRHSLAWPDDFEGLDGRAYEVLNLDPALVGLSHEEGTPMRLDPPSAGVEAAVELIFTYEVEYLPSAVSYASRWDVYLQLEEGAQVRRPGQPPVPSLPLGRGQNANHVLGIGYAASLSMRDSVIYIGSATGWHSWQPLTPPRLGPRPASD